MRLLTCTDKHDMVSSSVFVTQHCSSPVDTGNPSRILDCLHIPENMIRMVHICKYLASCALPK